MKTREAEKSHLFYSIVSWQGNLYIIYSYILLTHRERERYMRVKLCIQIVIAEEETAKPHEVR